MEFKIVVYVICLTTILGIISRILHSETGMNWEYYQQETGIGAIYYILKIIIIIYLSLRLAIIPITLWWFK